MAVPASVGSGPVHRRVVLALENGARFHVTGALAREVGSLAGTRVEVRGRRGEQRTVEAT